jgi:hypothetical protein
MVIPPLLPESVVKNLFLLLKEKKGDEAILDMLKGFPLEEKIHILRFLSNKGEDEWIPHIFRVWRSLVPVNHRLNTETNRRALQEIGQWWDAFGVREGMTVQQYDELEQVLDRLGATSDGKDFFRWVALYPVGSEHGTIWDEDRRGAIVCLGKYAFSPETELFLARHLDDWNTIQVEVVYILAAAKSRLLARMAPWYMKNDDGLQPILEEFF